MQAFLEYVVKGLVQQPEKVLITAVERGGQTIFELRLDSADAGRVIGRQGQTINAIRALLQAGAARKGVRCSLELVDEKPVM
jgi:predicted RNA-binding protein YlqC (UPF0109 family)